MTEQSLTIGNTVVTLEEAMYKQQSFMKATSATITVEGAPFRYRLAGTPPSTTDGHLVGVGDVITLNDHNEIKGFMAIRTTAVDATCWVTFSFGE